MAKCPFSGSTQGITCITLCLADTSPLALIGYNSFSGLSERSQGSLSQEIYKIREHPTLPESTEVFKNNDDTHNDGSMIKGYRKQVEELPMVKIGTI